MGRRGHPWYRADRDAWYVKLDGRPLMLAKGKASKAVAEAAFHKLKSEMAGGRSLPDAAPSFGELASRYLRDLANRVKADELSPTTYDDAKRRLARFVAEYGDRPVDRLKPADVLDWLDRQEGWGPTSRHDAVGAIKAVTRWAHKLGLVAHDSLAATRKPTRKQRREEVLSPTDWAKVLDAIRCDDFRDLVSLMHATGCRLGEAARLEAKHIDWDRGVAIVSGKTTRRTGRKLVLAIPDAILARLRVLASIRPTGPLLLNSRGNPWRKDAVNNQVVRLRRRTGLGGELVAQSLRHLFATDALDRGVPIATVAQLLNHADTRMVSRNYGHLAERYEHLRDAVARIRPDAACAPASADPSSPSPPATTSGSAAEERGPQPPAPPAEASPGSEHGTRPPARARSRSSHAPSLGSGNGSAKAGRSRKARTRSTP
jgi:integrase